jgi:cob(I)alamin adenosyltransferase
VKRAVAPVSGRLTPVDPGDSAGPQAGTSRQFRDPRCIENTKERCLPETRKGLILVYTGPGKGKTTAALRIAFRAVGQGMKVLMVQFIKGSWHYGELDAAKMLGRDQFEILPMGRGFVKIGVEKPDPENLRLVRDARSFACQQMSGSQYDVVILDEINYAISYKMLDPEDVLSQLRPEAGSAARGSDRA